MTTEQTVTPPTDPPPAPLTAAEVIRNAETKGLDVDAELNAYGFTPDGYKTDTPEDFVEPAPAQRFYLFTVDCEFPPNEQPVMFEAQIPQPALFQRCYVTTRPKSAIAALSGRPPPPVKIARLVFLVADGAPPIAASFALVSMKRSVPLDPSRLCEVVIDHGTGQPWGLWLAPQMPPEASSP